MRNKENEEPMQKSYLHYWTECEMDAPPAYAGSSFPIRCYFDNDSDRGDESYREKAIKALDELNTLAERGSQLKKFARWYIPSQSRPQHPIPPRASLCEWNSQKQ